MAKVLKISEQPFDLRIGLIQSLIPLGLAMVNEELQNELMELIGENTTAKEKTRIITDGDKMGNSLLAILTRKTISKTDRLEQ